MSREKVMMGAVAGAGLIGATMYGTRGNSNETQAKRNQAQEKRDLGLGGAGVGGNGEHSERKQVTTAESRDKLPPGMSDGGEGAGGSSTRRNQIPFPWSSPGASCGDSRGDSKNESIISQATSMNQSSRGSEWFSSVKSTVGGKSTATRKDAEGVHDTRGISKVGSETPPKRGPADASD